MRLTPWVEAGVQRNLSGSERVAAVSAGPFDALVSGVSPAPTAGTAGVGIRIAAGDGLDGFLRYEGLFSANQVESAFSAGISCRF